MSPSLPPSAAVRLALGFTALCFAVVAAQSGCAQETPCQFNSDCAVGYCSQGTCKRNCAESSRDCPPGYTCNENAECVPGSTGGGGAGSSTSSSGTGATTSTSGTSTSTSTASMSSSTSTSGTNTSTSSTGGPANKHELDPCASDGDCASPLVCRPMTQGGEKRCTRTCASTATCMTGTVCDLIGSTQYCAADDAGRPCTAASDCNFGCFTAQQYCTVACNTGADCPNGYGCKTVGQARACVMAEAICSTSDISACVDECDVSPQMVVGGCTLSCSSVLDCPVRAAGFSPWTCDGSCRRPPDVFGPLPTGAKPAQYACNVLDQVVNVCNDAQHIDYMAFDVPPVPSVSCVNQTMTTPGVATDSCVDSCRYEGGCPFGFACVALGSVDNGQSRVGLCLPTGGGEVGAPCTYPGDCVFGYCLASGTCSRDCTADGVCPGGSSCVAGGGPDVEGQPFRRCQ